LEAAPAVFQIHIADESGKLAALPQGPIPNEPRTYTELLDDDKMYNARFVLSICVVEINEDFNQQYPAPASDP